MSTLKNESLKKCFSVLETYLNGDAAQGDQRKTAILALNQLQRITAGNDPDPDDKQCSESPRASG